MVLLHCKVRLAGSSVDVGTGLTRPWHTLLLENCGNVVTAFFALSGFLITFTSLRRFGSLPQVQPSLYYRIHFARIAPLLVLTLTAL